MNKPTGIWKEWLKEAAENLFDSSDNLDYLIEFKHFEITTSFTHEKLGIALITQEYVHFSKVCSCQLYQC